MGCNFRSKPTSSFFNLEISYLSLVKRFLRDDITEVLVDTMKLLKNMILLQIMPDFEDKIKKYDEAIPLFTRYQMRAIETAYQRGFFLARIVFRPN